MMSPTGARKETGIGPAPTNREVPQARENVEGQRPLSKGAGLVRSMSKQHNCNNKEEQQQRVPRGKENGRDIINMQHVRSSLKH